MMNKRGISVLEILVAIVILAGAISPIYYIFKVSTLANKKSIKYIQAANLAEEKMEEYKYSGATPLNFGVNDNILLHPMNEFKRLAMLLEVEKNKKHSKQYVKYVKEEDYGEIENYPDFKRKVEIAYFPKVNVNPAAFASPYKDAGTPPSITSPTAVHEYIRLTKRISIIVNVTYKEKFGKNITERNFTAFTIITNKEF